MEIKNKEEIFGIFMIGILLISGFIAITVTATSINTDSVEKFDNISKTIINFDKEETFIMRSLSNPISLDEINTIEEKMINKHKQMQKPGQIIKPITKSIPIIPKNAKIVVYGFKITPDGKTFKYIGVVQQNISKQDKDKLKIYNDGIEWYKEYIYNDKSGENDKDVLETILNLNSVDATGSPDYSSFDWRLLGSDKYTYEFEPYGIVSNLYYLYWLSDDWSYTYDWFATVQTTELYPGSTEWGNQYQNKYASSRQFWVDNGHMSPYLWERKPMGTLSGTQSTSVTIGAGIDKGGGGVSGGITWGYEQPDVSRADISSQSEQTAEWKWTFNSPEAKRYSTGFETGSTCRVTVPSDSNQHQLLYTTSRGEFSDYGWWTEHGGWANVDWNFYVRYQ